MTLEESVVRYEVWCGDRIQYSGQFHARESAQEVADKLNGILPETKWYVKVVQI